MARGDGRAVGAGNLLLAGNRPDARAALPGHARAGRARRRAADPDLERALRHRGGAADHRHGARGVRLVSIACRSRSTPATAAARRSQGARRPLPASGRCARCRPRFGRSTSSLDGDVVRRSPSLSRRISSWSVVNLMEPREVAAVCVAARSCSAATLSSIFRHSRQARRAACSRS